MSRELKEEYKAIIIHEVVNELKLCNAENMCDEISRVKQETAELVDRIKSVQPDTVVYISLGVQSQADRESLRYQTLQAVNATLRTVKNAKYIEHANIGNSSHFLSDGIHMSEAGTKLLASNLRRIIEPDAKRYKSPERTQYRSPARPKQEYSEYPDDRVPQRQYRPRGFGNRRQFPRGPRNNTSRQLSQYRPRSSSRNGWW